MADEDTSGSFEEFYKLLEKIGKQSKHTEKTKIIENYLKSFDGDLFIFFRLLLSREDKRVFNIRGRFSLFLLFFVNLIYFYFPLIYKKQKELWLKFYQLY